MQRNLNENKRVVDKILRDIYTRRGKLPNFDSIEIKKEKRTKKFLILLIVFFASLAAAAWAGFFIFKPYAKFGGKGVKFEIRGPEQIVSGGESNLDIQIINSSDVPLAESSVFLMLPQEFSLIKSDPAPQTANTWVLGTLEPGGKHQIKLKGAVIKEIGGEFLLNATLTYKPANFNSDFQNVASFKAGVSSSILETAIETAAEHSVGDEAVFKIKYRNLSEVEAASAAIKVILPEHFIFVTSTKPFSDKEEVLIEKLGPNSEGGFEIYGTFSTAANESEKLVSQISFIRKDNFILQHQSEISLALIGSDLALDLTINGGKEEVLSFGDVVYGAVHFKNTGAKTLQNVALSAIFESNPLKNDKSLIDWATFKEPFGARRESLKVTWDSNSLMLLKELAPGEEGNVDFSFNLIDKPFTFENRDYKISFHIEGLIEKINGKKVDRLVSSQKLIFPILTDLSFEATGRYFNEDNIALGLGPLPPKVGEKTTYRIFWTIKNSLHDLSEITVKAKMPKNVSFGPRSIVPVGTLSHTEDEIVWRIENLSSLVSRAEVSFDLGVIPQVGDVGKVLNLLEASEITAKDVALDKTTVLTPDPITTEITEDEEGRGRGAVAP